MTIINMEKLSFLQEAYDEAMEFQQEAERIGDQNLARFWEEHCEELDTYLTALYLGIPVDELEDAF